MNKKHIVTSVGVVLLATGVIGGIWSGISAMPKIINNAQMMEEKYNEKEVLYNSELNLSKLNIELSSSDIIIKKHNKKNVLVERSGNKELSNLVAKRQNDELVIKEERKDNIKQTKNIDDIVKYVIEEYYSYEISNITVYLPEEMDIDISTEGGTLSVEDDIILDTLNFETDHGHIVLDSDLKFKNLNVKSKDNVSLSVDEIAGIENISVICNNANIHGRRVVEDEEQMPQKLEIKTTSSDYDSIDVDIDTNIPVAKNLVIDSGSRVYIRLPILDYKFNFDVKALRGVDFNSESYDKYKSTAVGKYFKESYEYANEGNDEERDLKNEFVGLINENLKDVPDEYVVKVKSEYTIFN